MLRDSLHAQANVATFVAGACAAVGALLLITPPGRTDLASASPKACSSNVRTRIGRSGERYTRGHNRGVIDTLLVCPSPGQPM
ncbi:MAG TPA: hypothetical protein VKE51_07440 [Vicinamibacterales bacterium]|nr:hypothetical protein [Vicinamibacterales bacterium]